MRYLLVVGFACDVYRQEPRARVYFNDQLIDEFFIENHIKNVELDTKHPLEPIPRQKLIEHRTKCLPPLHLYELDIHKESKHANIRIDINNDDNNYTNGFMNQTTLIQCRILSLLPKDKSVHDYFVHHMRHRMLSHRYAWFRKNKMNLLVDLTNSVEVRGNHGQKKNVLSPGQTIHFYNIGGSCSLHCELIKKYDMLIPKLQITNKPYLYEMHGLLNNIIYNKYKQHENI
jgi:hypothetical protein